MYHIVIFLIVFNFYLCLCFDFAWNSYQNEFIGEDREELVITQVKEDEHFTVQNSVKKWTSLNIGSVCYTAGVTEKSIIILTSTLASGQTGFNVSSQEIGLEAKLLDIILIYDKRIASESEVIVAVAFETKPQLDWFKIQESKLVKFWSWPLEAPVLHFNYYSFQSKDLLLLAHNEIDGSVAHLYSFNLKFKKPVRRLLASLDLQESITSSAFNEFEGHLFWSFPQHQHGTVLTYIHNDLEFYFFQEIKSPEVKKVISFNIGVKSYLAIDGYNAGIYEGSEDGWIRRNITNSNLDNIHYWLSVPVLTYRDEVILFAQRALDHYTHSTYAVDIITNNGGQFEEHEDIPCTHLGEKSEWLTCLSQDSGIIGSSYIYIGDKLGLIVPRPSRNSSDLFLIYYEIKQMPHPKKEEISLLFSRKEQLQALLDSQLAEYEDLKNYQHKLFSQPAKIKESVEHKVGAAREADSFDIGEKIKEIGLKLKGIKENVDKIIASENKTNFDTIVITGNVIIENIKTRSLHIDTIGELGATQILEDIVSKERLFNVTGNKTFTDLSVDNLEFETVNQIKAADLIDHDESVISLNGSVIFEGPLIAETVELEAGNVNEISFKSQVVTVQEQYADQLKFEEIEVVDNFKVEEINGKKLNETARSEDEIREFETLDVKKNVTVTFINSLNFTEFLHQLCFINTSCYLLGNVTIDGNITANETFTEYLNNLKFPQDYLLQDSIDHANITGKKIFKNGLSAEEIQTKGKISGVDTAKLITKTTDQEIPGKVVFEDLELTEVLNVTGKILGNHTKQFLANPTLETVKTIKSNVNFKKLVVEGKIIINNAFNGKDFNALLNDIIYKNEDTVEITGQKDFSNGLNIKQNLEIETNSINEVKLDSLVTKESDQDLQLRILKGDVKIQNLFVHGKYDGKNVTQLDESFVKLTGEQFISSTLIFNDDLNADTLEIEKLNDLTADEYLYTTEEAEIHIPINFESILAENVLVQGNFHGRIMDLDLDGIESKYLSLTQNQTIDVPFELQQATIDNLQTENSNFKDEDLLDSATILEEIWKILNNGSVDIENLIVDGFLKINKINNKTVESLLPKNPLLSKNMTGNITIDGDVFINDLEIQQLSSFNWDKLMKLIVFKNESNIVLKGTKHFLNNIIVEKLIETTKINDIRLEDILIKDGEQHIKGPIVIEGDAVLKNLEVAETINQMPVKDVLERIKISNGTYIINGDMVFEKLAYIHDFHIKGSLNNQDIKEVLEDLVFLDREGVLEVPMTFKEPVTIFGDLTVPGQINDIKFSNLVPQLILTTGSGTIKGPVSFSKTVLIADSLKINEDLETATLFNYDTDDWLRRAVFVNKGLLMGNYSFENITISDELTSKFINDINMNNIVPLSADQLIEQLVFEEVIVVRDVEVDGLVNGMKLFKEVSNTVMSNLEQEIFTDVVFLNNTLIRGNLIVDRINDNDASRIVTTNTDQDLFGLYNFNSQCIIYSDLEVSGLINGINISQWKENLKLFSPDVQTVDKELIVTNNITFSDNVDGQVTIDELDLKLLTEEVGRRRDYKHMFEQGIIDDYNNMCIDVKFLYQKSRTQIYNFKYFEDFQQIFFRNILQNVFFFEFQNNRYLLASDNQCRSHLYIFNSTAFVLLQSNIKTGEVSQIVRVNDNSDDMYLVTLGRQQECVVNGTNIWKFDNVTGELQIKFKSEDHDLIQESLVPNTFYGLRSGEVLEYNIDEDKYRIYRKWMIEEENVAFIPRGLKTGLALRTGQQIIFLDRSDQNLEDFDLDSEEIIIGSTKAVSNHYLPGRNDQDIVVIPVGVKSARKNWLAVISPTQTVRRNMDVIKIYENALEGDIFQEIRAYKPSSLVVIQFEQGETLLAFLEDQKVLQIYEYKGVEGFKHRSSAKISGSKIITMTLPIKGNLNTRKALGIIDNDSLKIIQSVMVGNKIEDEFDCGV